MVQQTKNSLPYKYKHIRVNTKKVEHRFETGSIVCVRFQPNPVTASKSSVVSVQLQVLVAMVTDAGCHDDNSQYT